MKRILTSLLLIGTLQGFSSFAAEPTTREVTLGVSDVFIPGGIGPETDAYVVVSGMFPNSCYKWDRSEVNHTSPNFHEVRSVATVSQTMCLMVLVPYSKEVALGRLGSGEHTLRFVNGDGTYFERTLEVE